MKGLLYMILSLVLLGCQQVSTGNSSSPEDSVPSLDSIQIELNNQTLKPLEQVANEFIHAEGNFGGGHLFGPISEVKADSLWTFTQSCQGEEITVSVSEFYDLVSSNTYTFSPILLQIEVNWKGQRAYFFVDTVNPHEWTFQRVKGCTLFGEFSSSLVGYSEFYAFDFSNNRISRSTKLMEEWQAENRGEILERKLSQLEKWENEFQFKCLQAVFE